MTDAVALVLDPDFGSQLAELAKKMPVWLISSATNTEAADIVRAAEAEQVTTVLIRTNEDIEDFLLRAAYAIDEHHGGVSQSTPYRTLWVYGVSDKVAPPELIAELGFRSILPMPWGFKAEK